MSKALETLVNIPTLEDKHITNLKNYKYASCEYTALDKIINHFWLFAVKFVPRVG